MGSLFLKNSFVSLITLALLTGAAVDCHAGGGGSRLVYESDDKAKSGLKNINNSNIDDEDSDEEEVVALPPAPPPMIEEAPATVASLLLPHDVLINCIIPLLPASSVVHFGGSCRHLRGAVLKSQLWTRVSEHLKKGSMKPLKGVSILDLEQRDKDYTEFLSRLSLHLLQANPELDTKDVFAAAYPTLSPETRVGVLWEMCEIQRKGNLTEKQVDEHIKQLADKDDPAQICILTNGLLTGPKRDYQVKDLLKTVTELGGDRERVCRAAYHLQQVGIEIGKIALGTIKKLGEECVDICCAYIPVYDDWFRLEENKLEVLKKLGKDRKAIVQAAIKNNLLRHHGTYLLEDMLYPIRDLRRDKAQVCSLAKLFVSKNSSEHERVNILQTLDTLQLIEGVEPSDQELTHFCTLIKEIEGQHQFYGTEIIKFMSVLKSLGVKYAEIWRKIEIFIPKKSYSEEVVSAVTKAKELGEDLDEVIGYINKYNLFKYTFRGSSNIVTDIKKEDREAVFSAAEVLLFDDNTINRKSKTLQAVHQLGADPKLKIELAKKIGLLADHQNEDFVRSLDCVKNFTQDHEVIGTELKDILPPMVHGGLAESYHRGYLRSLLQEISKVDDLLTTIKLAKSCGVLCKGLNVEDVKVLIVKFGLLGPNKEAFALNVTKNIQAGVSMENVRKYLFEFTGQPAKQ